MQHLSVKTLTLVGQRPSLYVDRKTLYRKPPKYTSRELHGTSRNAGFETVVFWTQFTSRELHGNFTELHGMRVLKKRHLVDNFVEPNNKSLVYYICGGGVYINLHIYIHIIGGVSKKGVPDLYQLT